MTENPVATTVRPRPSLPAGPPATWTMEERAQAARHRHHAVALRSAAKASGLTEDEYLTDMAITEPEAAAQGAALLAYDGYLRAKDEAAREAREGTADEWQRRARVAEDRVKELEGVVDRMASERDKLFQRMRAIENRSAAAARARSRGSK